MVLMRDWVMARLMYLKLPMLPITPMVMTVMATISSTRVTPARRRPVK